MSDTFISDLELDNLIKEKNDRDLLEFTARSAYKSSVVLVDHTKRIKVLENKDRRFMGTIGGIGGIIGAGIASAINYFLNKS